MRKFITALAITLVGVAIATSIRVFLQIGGPAQEGRPREPIGIPSPVVASKVYFQPLSSYPVADAEELASHYRTKFGLSIEVLEPISIPEGAFDRERGQAVAERLIDQIKTVDVLNEDPNAIVIGLTVVDMYIAELSWNFAFNWRSDGHLAVVSTSVMDDLGADRALQMRRLQKMVTKDLGILYYGLRGNDDPGSVLYRNVNGVRELDRMSEDF
jgi:predicted Zn-dependent protease